MGHGACPLCDSGPLGPMSFGLSSQDRPGDGGEGQGDERSDDGCRCEGDRQARTFEWNMAQGPTSEPDWVEPAAVVIPASMSLDIQTPPPIA